MIKIFKKAKILEKSQIRKFQLDDATLNPTCCATVVDRPLGWGSSGSGTPTQGVKAVAERLPYNHLVRWDDGSCRR
jgi:hypothetical protein